MPTIPVFTLIRTDTTLDLSQKAEKGERFRMRGAAFFMGLRVLRNFNATFKNLDAYAATYPSIGAAFSDRE